MITSFATRTRPGGTRHLIKEYKIMAKYQITHSCGHQSELQLYGKNDSREWAIERAERGLCTECWKLQKEKEREEAGIQAQAIAAERGWVRLEGSEKQVLWAETIRLSVLVDLNPLVEQCQLRAVSETMIASLTATADWAEGIKDAKWWIDNKPEADQNNLIGLLSLMTGKNRQPTPTTAECMKHLILLSPHTTLEVAELCGLKDKWLKQQEVKAGQAVESEYWAKGKTLAAECCEANWDAAGDAVKPWWKDKSDGRHLRLYIGEAEIAWLKCRFADTVKFKGIADTTANRALTERVFSWCNSSTDKSMKILRLK